MCLGCLGAHSFQCTSYTHHLQWHYNAFQVHLQGLQLTRQSISTIPSPTTRYILIVSIPEVFKSLN